MRHTIFILVGLGLAACGPSTTGPGEISGFGLVYDQRPGYQFEGLPKTTLAQMPATVGTMTGPSRISSSDGTMVFDDATLTVDVNAQVVTYEGSYTFPDAHPLGIIQVNQSATLIGTRFETNPEGTTVTEISDDYLSGDFYGTDGSVAAGFFAQEGVEDELFHGAFIVSSEN